MNKCDKCTIYVVTHKKVENKYNRELYNIIQVGQSSNNNEINELKDNTGDNISSKNNNYCELTALYWIWKNDKKSDIIGITHYRRFFTKNILNKIIKKPLSEKNIKKILDKYDIIVPNPMIMKEKNVIQQYDNTHYKEDLYVCGEIIEKKYPEYYNSFIKVINRKYYSQFNMLICNQKIYNQYMQWLFDILFEAEKQIDISNYNEYNKRIFGFLSERLLNVWLEENKNLKVKELQVYNLEQNINFIRLIFSNIRYKLNRKKIEMRYNCEKNKCSRL